MEIQQVSLEDQGRGSKKRVRSIDLARGIGVLLLVPLHTLWMYADVKTQSNTLLGEFIHFTGTGTGMFLITMGFSFTMSRNQSLKLTFRRGALLLLVGYGMNFLKFVFPNLLGFQPVDLIKAYGWTPPATFDNLLYMLGTGDILQMAGISLFIMGIANHLSKNKFVPLGMAVFFAVATSFVRGIRAGVPGFDYFLDLLWGEQFNVYFPVFPWISLILAGIYFGRVYLEDDRDEKRAFRQMWQIGLLFVLGGLALSSYDYKRFYGDYFHLGSGGALYLIGASLLLARFAKFLVDVTKPNKIFNFFYYLSARITSFYVIQWVLICWGMGLVGFQKMNAGQVLLAMAVMIVLCLITQKGVDLIKGRGKRKKSDKEEVIKEVAQEEVLA
ncbi:MAG TPA: hypothetical protein DCS93_42725 [Microscillaceae bacterium]|nr:hypothetical protein [Microscillaceae bacterium]